MKNVLILGGGFAGIQAAIDLQQTKIFHVTLISDREYFFNYPISIWIPTRASTFEKTKIDLSAIQKAYGFNVIIDSVKKIVSGEQKVYCEKAAHKYDYLIIGIGAEKVLHEGIEHTVSLCRKPEDSLLIRDKLDTLIERGHGKIAVGFSGNPKDPSAVRGGPAFEVLFNIHTALKKKGIRKAFELTFFAPMESPGARMGNKALTLVDSIFSSYGIRKKLGKKILSFSENAIHFEDGTQVEADLIFFIPATAGHSVLQRSDLPLNAAGFVMIDDGCLVRGTQNVYAVGDTAALEGPDWRAKQGHTAEVMANIAAFNITKSEEGSLKRKGYGKHLSILCIMDTGSGAALVYRDEKRNFVIPMPVFGHWLKQLWGIYTRLTKTGRIPRIPGL